MEYKMIHENIYMHDVIDIFDVYQKDDLLKKSKLGLMKNGILSQL